MSFEICVIINYKEAWGGFDGDSARPPSRAKEGEHAQLTPEAQIGIEYRLYSGSPVWIEPKKQSRLYLSLNTSYRGLTLRVLHRATQAIHVHSLNGTWQGSFIKVCGFRLCKKEFFATLRLGPMRAAFGVTQRPWLWTSWNQRPFNGQRLTDFDAHMLILYVWCILKNL